MPAQHTRDALDYLIAIGPLIGVTAALIVGFAQAYLQREQLKYNLFDKRFALYTEVGTFFLALMRDDYSFRYSDVDRFRVRTAHAGFLFGQEVIDFLTVMDRKATELAQVNSNILRLIPQPGNLDELSAQEQLHRHLLGWISDAYAHQNTVFHDYLEISAELPWYARLERYMDGMQDRLDAVLKRKAETA